MRVQLTRPTPPTHAWQVMYPPRACYAQGWLDVGDGHAIYWEECGNPLGQPALFIHGGPGAGCKPDDRRWFDPARYRIVLFDQRGAGRSRPLGSCHANTTEHLLQDMELLRQHLRIERWLLFGGSWGSTLALAYAQRHPQRVRALVLRGVFTATFAEQEALYGAGRPAWLAHLALQLAEQLAVHPASQGVEPRDERPHRAHADAAKQAARTWWRWEQDLLDSESGSPAAPEPQADNLLASARIGVHFARHDFFIDALPPLAQAQAHARALRQIPGIIVQGERDQVTPAAAARALHAAWPNAQLRIVANAGHASGHPAIAQQLIAATDSLAQHPLSGA